MEKEKPRLSRLTAILTLLQSRRMITAREIAEKHHVSIRTVYRDMRTLEQSGIPIITEEGKGYSIMEGYILPPVMFTEEEANALITAAAFIAQNKDRSLIDNHTSAINKVKSVLRTKGKDKAELLSERMFFMNNLQREVTSQNLSTVQRAITNRHVMILTYQSASKNESTERPIEPLALYHTSNNWILIAWCRLRKDNREFRLDRIKEFKVTDEVFELKEFDLYTYFQRYNEK